MDVPNRRRLSHTRYAIVLSMLLFALAARAQLDPTLPVIAGPIGFNVVMIDESTVEFSWNPKLIDGSEARYFKVRNSNRLLAETTESRWRLSGIDRDISYDFSVSAVISTGEETRRSDRVYYDLPQLSETAEDGFNAYLPPFESFQAEVIDEDSVKLSWTPGRDYWSWANPSEYQYGVVIDGSRVALVDDTSYVLTGLTDRGIFWVDLYANAAGQLYSRQSNTVLVDTSQAAGTITSGYPGFNGLYGLRTEVYSSTAAELFWDYNGSPETAHVFLDGRIVARIPEGKSLFLDNLTPGTRTSVSIAEGWPYDSPQEQYKWLLSHDGPMMYGWIETPGHAPENLGYPEPVTGLRVEVYGSNAAEVFWDRSDAVLARYKVYVNGKLLTETDAVSWYLSELVSGANITVGVMALGPNGSDTEQRQVTFSTPQSGQTTTECGVTGLRAEVYSKTAAEIIWDRSVSGTQYNAWLDDQFLATTDATSWYSDTYRPGSSHTFTLENANPGCEASKSSVAFQLSGDSDGQHTEGVPSSPTGVYAEVYSSTAAELFWQRSDDDGWVVGYDIARDGVIVAAALDATSYFDDALTPGQDVVYTVFAVDNDGNRSTAASVDVSVSGNDQHSLINKSNHVELISKVFDIYVGDFYTGPIDEIGEFNITGRNDDGSFIDVFDCDSGSFTQNLDPTSTNAGVFFRFDFNQCQQGDDLYNGYISGQDSARGLNVTTNQFSIEETDSGNTASYSGYIQKWISQTAFFDQIHSFDTGGDNGVSVELNNADTNIQLEQMATSFAYGSQTNGLDIARLKGGFQVWIPETDNMALSVSTPVEFSYKLNTRTDGATINDVPPFGEPITATLRNNWVFSNGQLLLMAEDGSKLTLDAGNGILSSVTITIENNTGTAVFDQPWTLWKENLRFDNSPDIAR